MMMFRSKRIVVLVAAALLVALPVRAQRLEWEVNASGFFDNSEGEGTYRTDDTYGGIHLQPLLSAVESRGRHRITAGYDAFVEWGADNRLDANGLMAFYEYSSGPLRILMGKYPRRKMLQEWPDYLICDSIRYFRPSQTGFDIQYVRPKGHVEVFLDWTAKRTETVREQFMVGFDGRYAGGQFQMGINGYYYHYANELHGAEMGHKPHDNAVVHPYVGFCWQHPGVLDSLDVKAGMLLGADRDRATDNRFHVPAGFLGEVEAQWRRVEMKETFYAGGRQQQYGPSGFGQYYWGDAYLRSPWYSRTDVSYHIVADEHVTLKAGAAFHLTDKGLHFNQMLTLSARLGN